MAFLNPLYFTIGDEIIAAQPGTFVTGYLTAEGLEALGRFALESPIYC